MNQRRPVMIAALLAVATALSLQAKSYEIELARPMVAGNVELKPGAYRVELKDGAVVLSFASNGKSVNVPVKVINADHKFKATTVSSDTQAKPEQLKAIELGGSKVRLEFGSKAEGAPAGR